MPSDSSRRSVTCHSWFLATFVPRLFKFDLPKVCEEYEAAHGTGNAGGTTAYREFSARAYRWENPDLFGLTVDQIEARYGHAIFVRRMRVGEGAPIVDCVGSTSLQPGAIVAGIVCGYLRSTMRTFGRIPGPALWVFSNVGLNGFIAVVGLKAASGFVSGLQQYGLTLFLAGVVVTLVPLIVGVLLGKYVFKFHPGILL
ncbi:hypothetical protein HF319_14110, partial [Xanthomonas sp. Kuri4-1]